MGSLAGLTKFFWHKKEAFFWIAALIFLASQDPGNHHYTLCPISNMGFDFCPGCGLGRAISYFFRGDFVESLYAHPLGIAAVFILVYRSYRILFGKTKLVFTNASV